MIEVWQGGNRVLVDELGRAYDPVAQRWETRLALHNLGSNLVIAGALEHARRLGMQDVFTAMDEVCEPWSDSAG